MTFVKLISVDMYTVHTVYCVKYRRKIDNPEMHSATTVRTNTIHYIRDSLEYNVGRYVLQQFVPIFIVPIKTHAPNHRGARMMWILAQHTHMLEDTQSYYYYYCCSCCTTAMAGICGIHLLVKVPFIFGIAVRDLSACTGTWLLSIKYIVNSIKQTVEQITLKHAKNICIHTFVSYVKLFKCTENVDVLVYNLYVCKFSASSASLATWMATRWLVDHTIKCYRWKFYAMMLLLEYGSISWERKKSL